MKENRFLKDERFVKETVAAEILGLSVITLRNWRCLGKGPQYLKLSDRAIRYRVNDLLAWAESHVVVPEQTKKRTRRVKNGQ